MAQRMIEKKRIPWKDQWMPGKLKKYWKNQGIGRFKGEGKSKVKENQG